MILEHEYGRRKELSDFLRTRRERLSPVEAGLAGGVRRRTPGLRREEVALLANIGVTWYTRLEQGQPINASVDVVGRIAEVLRMTLAEREHLHTLCGHPFTTPLPAQESPPDAVLNLLEVLDPSPALCLNRAWDVLAWNRGAAALLGDFATFTKQQRNVIWRFYMEPAQRVLLPRWDGIGCNLTAQFRAAAARYPDDPRFAELIAELLEGSAEFRTQWASHDVRGYTEGHKHLFHPKIGNIVLEYTRLNVPSQADMRVAVYMAKPGSREAQQLASLLDDPAVVPV